MNEETKRFGLAGGLSHEARLLTLEQFSAESGLGTTRIYDLLGKRELRAIKVGKRTMIRREDADAWFASLPAYVPQRERAA